MGKVEQRAFKDALKAYRRGLNASAKTRSKQKLPTNWLFPWASEKEYAQEIGKTIYNLIEKKDSYLPSKYEGWLKDSRVDKADSTIKKMAKKIGVLKQDDYVDEIGQMFSELNEVLEETFGVSIQDNTIISLLLVKISLEIDEFNEKQWLKATANVLGGFEYSTAETWREPALKQWRQTNFRLVKSLNEEYIKKLNIIIDEAISQEKRWEDVAPKVKSLDKDMSGYRSRLIARDQVAKLNSELARRRQQEIGVNNYQWLTSNDERVRSSHKPLDGKICKYGDNTVYAERTSLEKGRFNWKLRPASWVQLAPGQDIQCRCSGLAIFDTIISEVDEEIAKEN